MNAFLEQQIRGLVAPLEDAARRLLRRAALGLIALLAFLAALALLTVAGYVWLTAMTGAILAGVIIAAGYAVIALICVLLLGSGGRAKATKPEAKTQTPTEAADNVASAPSAQDASRAAEIDRAIAPILDVLQDAGLQKANLGVELAGEIAKQIKPMTLVAIAFVAGLVFGRRGLFPRD